MSRTHSCILLSPKAALRPIAERGLVDVYRNAFGARLPPLPPTVATLLDGSGVPAAAAGLRWRPEGFFLNRYLPAPLTDCLPPAETERRLRLVEVCHLGAWAHGAGAPFIRGIVDLCLGAGADWALFTATRPLRALLARLRLPVRMIAPADASRVGNPGVWGRYYEFEPWVCAVGRDALVVGEAGR